MILGIDIGNKFTTIAGIQNDHIEILLNEVSGRRSRTICSLDPSSKRRIIGDLAYTNFISNYKNSIINIKHSIKTDNNIPIHQLLTGILNYGVKLGNFNDKGNIVLTIPSYYSEYEKQIYLDAGKIANLNVSLYDEPSAVCLYYGFYNCKNITSKNVIFIDIGDINCTIYYATFTNIECHIKLVKCIPIGGLFFDQKIYNYFCDEIKEKLNINIRDGYVKSTVKMFKMCEELKKDLSIMPNATKTIECLYDEVDYKFNMNVDVFNDILKNDINLFKNTLEHFQDIKNNVDHIELLGGCSRIPIFKKVVEDFFEKVASNTLSTEETIAKGAVLKAINNTSNIKTTKKYIINEYIYNKTILNCSINDLSYECDKNNNKFEIDVITDNEFIEIYTPDKNKVWQIKLVKEEKENNDVKIFIDTKYTNGILNIEKVYMAKDKKLEYKLINNSYIITDETIEKLRDIEVKILRHNKQLDELESKKNKLECYIYEQLDKYLNDEYLNNVIDEIGQIDEIEGIDKLIKNIKEYIKNKILI
jgi:molecular chaperone DnaK (HSP70)